MRVRGDWRAASSLYRVVCRAALAGDNLKTDAGWKGRDMLMQELVVSLRDDVWGVQLGNHLLAVRPTQMAAVSVAQTIARAAAVHGVRSKILVRDLDGSPIEFPMIEPRNQPAVDTA